MKIAVLGAGPIGATIASFLAIRGEDVWLVDPQQSIIAPIAEKGATIYVSDSFEDDAKVTKYEAHPNTALNAVEIGVADAVVVAVKGFHTHSAVENLRLLADENTLILSAQNGLGNADILEEYFPGQIGYGVLIFAGNLIPREPGSYATTLYTPTIHLPVTTNHEKMIPKLKALSAILKDTPFNLEYEEPARLNKSLWKKLCLNIVVNPIGAIQEGPMDALFSQPAGIELVNHVIEEALNVARASGVELTREQIRLVPTKPQPKLPATAHRHYTSMCMDVVNHRPVENMALSGAVVSVGKRLGIPTPYNETLYLLMEIIEKTYDDQYSNQKQS